MSRIVIAVSLCLLQHTSTRAEVARTSERADATAWSQAVSGLECRIVQLPKPIGLRVALLFSVQFRNGGDEDLLLDATAVYDLPLTFFTDRGWTVELRPDEEVRRDLQLPVGRNVLRLRPGEIAAFSRPLAKSFQHPWKGYYAPYLPSGRRHHPILPDDPSSMKERAGMKVKFRYESAGHTSSPAGRKGKLWTGKIESVPTPVRVDQPTVRLGPAELKTLRKRTQGETLANLSCELTPLEPRSATGRPCWLRLSLRTCSYSPRQYRPVVNLLRSGGLIVTDAQGQAIPCLNAEPKKSAELRSIGGQGLVTLCEFDLASAYDLSRPGTYRVQFPVTGGDDETEVVLPASNVAEVEVVGNPEQALPSPRPVIRQVAIRGTVRGPAGAGTANAKVVLWPGPDGEYFTAIPDRPAGVPGAKATRADAEGNFVFAEVEPGAYWMLASHPDLGATLADASFAFQPEESYDLKLSNVQVRGRLLGQDGKNPVPAARVSLQPDGWRAERTRRVIPTSTTDGKGRFGIVGVVAGAYRLSVTLQGQEYPAFGRPLTVDDRVTDLELFMPSCSLSGKVITPEGEAVPNAIVSLAPAQAGLFCGSKHGRTDEKGEFTLTEIAEGDYGLRVEGPFRSAVGKGAPSDRADVNVSLSRGAPHPRVEVKLGERPPRLVATVLGLDGQPVGKRAFKGTAKTARGSAGGGFRTDENGVLRWNLRADTETHVVLFEEALRAWGETRVKPARGQAEIRATIRLRPCGSVAGRVVERGTGKPFGGFYVQPVPVGSPPTGWYPETSLYGTKGLDHISEDGTGAFSIPPLPPGEYEVSIRDSRRDSEEPDETPVKFKVEAGKTTEGIEIATLPVKNALAVQGLLVGQDGAPMREQELVLRGGRMSFLDPSIRRVRTDAQGRFSLYPIEPDFYVFTPFVPGKEGPAGPPVKFELKPGRGNQQIRVPLGLESETQFSEKMPPPDPPGTWGKAADGIQTRLTPVSPEFEQFDRVWGRLEVRNTGKWPKHYDTQGLRRSFRGKRPDGEPLAHVAQSYQTGSSGVGPLIAPGETKLVGEVDLTDEYDFSRIGKYQVQYVGWGLPSSNVTELKIVPRSADRPRPSIGLALPPGLVEAIRSALPENWAFRGTDGAWRMDEPGYESPRTVRIRYTKTVSTIEAARHGAGMSYRLMLYDTRLMGDGLVSLKDFRCLGENDWYRAYAKGQPDPRFGWKDPDGDIRKALKLKGPAPRQAD